ncbi:N-acetyl-gamma-glutamyl-phosphate reductase [Lacibacterium aquatile]
MSKPSIFIDGEAGTTGLQIRQRLEGRTDLEIVSIDHARRKDDAERKRLLNSVDLAILCLPDDAAKQAVAMIDNPAVKVLDPSSAHRVAEGWTYGFPEMLPGQAEKIAASKRVSNPGCYPTGAVALIRPLVDAGFIPDSYPISVNAVSGYTGGGNSLIAAFEDEASPNHTNDMFRLYGLELKHKHLPEMQKYGALAHKPMFVPSVGRFRQGMIVSVPLQLWALAKNPTAKDLHDALSQHYAGQRFVSVLPFDAKPAGLEPEGLNGTNQLELSVFANDDLVLLTARLDNLGKGASGAAVQNLDLMLGISAKHDYSLAA